VVPPFGFAVRSTDEPLEMVGDGGVMAPALRAGLTVTATGLDVETAPVTLSTTVAQ
jgi:hypothetical protein